MSDPHRRRFPHRPHRRLLCAAGLGAAGLWLGPGRAVAQPRQGTDYRVIQPAQQVDTPGKLEVLEFFWYGCPHCHALEPLIREWLKKLPADVAFRKLHVALGPSWAPHQQLFFTLEALGRSALDEKVFAAIHNDRNPLDKPEKMADFAAANGVDRKSFLDAYDSFSVKTRMRKAAQQAAAWGLEGVPGFGVNGKYFTAPSMAKGNAQALQVVDQLLEIERKARR